MSLPLTQEKGLIFRITHIDNIPWILRNGLHCASSSVLDPHFRRIGNQELIERRPRVAVPIASGGTLSDYIPFYFTPLSPMFFNIHTGYNGIEKLENREVVCLVTSLPELQKRRIPFVFTDRHAYEKTALFFNELTDLKVLPWKQLQETDFQRDQEFPLKISRYQAEALVHCRLPVDALMGIGCYTPEIQGELISMCKKVCPHIRVVHRPRWYF